MIKILMLDDYELWRGFVRSVLQKQPAIEIVGEAADGREAVHKAEQLQPDLILLDIGLPGLNGMEAARRIRQCAPKSKILFLSENRLREIAQAALATGASGYVLKSEAANELLPAVGAVLQGKQFVSASLKAIRVDHAAFAPIRREPSASLCNSDCGIENSA